MNWLSENYKWLFDGVAGAAVIAVIVHYFRRSLDRQGTAALTAQGAKVTNSPVASGSNISQNINSPTLNLSLATADEDRSSWPDVILECQWPSSVLKSRIPGSRTVRKRPWMLRHGGPGAVYNVHIQNIDFGAYEALFPFPVRTLTDIAAVYPIICRKSDRLVITPNDLESLLQSPPSGCDIRQYAVEIEETEGEVIGPGDVMPEVGIPVTISYDDKSGNRFRIKYLLHYDTYMKKGEMIRTGSITKVTPK